ncbi:MAG: MBL fold metallo-hydrolase [Vicinamibacterales bacterium]
MFQRFFDEGLAQASFLVACDRTKQAVVIDPRRDASIYTEAVRQHGLVITAAIETHVHADFVSGSRELAAATGARVIGGPGSHVAFDHHEVRDGEQLRVGDVTLTFLHTPGHTPEHVTVQVEERGAPVRLCTGDLLFVGGVGRPDLLGDAQTRQLAGALFDSLGRVLAMPDDVEVHPGHGAGSLCGAGIGKDPFSTIGRERRLNPMLQYGDKVAFVEAVLADVPETPAYFARMKRVNSEGPDILDLANATPRVPEIAPAAAAALAADGAIVLDLRPGAEFASGHPDGALNFAYGSKVGYWAGFVLAPGGPLLLLSDDRAQAQDAYVQLLRVGLDAVTGSIAGGIAAWTRAGLPVAEQPRMSADDLRRAMAQGERWHVIDVRTPTEWRGGHIDGSINVPVGGLPSHLGALPDGPLAVICEGGYRSALAASLLAHEGVPDVVNVADGMAAFRSAEATRLA